MKKHGGPAFPATEYYDEKPFGCDPGMSLRDYFAGQALAGFLGNVDLIQRSSAASQAHGNHPAADIAAQAYELADAMLEARAK